MTSNIETLICTNCSSAWQRQSTRGRKPRLCPTCLTAPSQVSSQREIKNQNTDFSVSYPPPTKWLCPVCKVSVSLYVAVDEPPTHSCDKTFLKKVLPLEKVM